jgi:hypothetical protein
MGEHFDAEDAKRFKHRLDEGRRQFQKPDLLSREHRVFQQAFACRQLGTDELPDALTLPVDTAGSLRICHQNHAMGEVIDPHPTALRDAVDRCGGLLKVRVARRSPATATFSIVCEPENDE